MPLRIFFYFLIIRLLLGSLKKYKKSIEPCIIIWNVGSVVLCFFFMYMYGDATLICYDSLKNYFYSELRTQIHF